MHIQYLPPHCTHCQNIDRAQFNSLIRPISRIGQVTVRPLQQTASCRTNISAHATIMPQPEDLKTLTKHSTIH